MHCLRAIPMLRITSMKCILWWQQLHLPPTLWPGISPSSGGAVEACLKELAAGRACQFYRAINFFARLPPNAPTFSALCTVSVCWGFFAPGGKTQDAWSHKVHNFGNIFVDRFLNTGKSSFRWHFYVQAGELAEGWLKRGGPLLSPFLMGRCYRGLVKDIKRWVADGGKLPSTKTSPTDLKPQHRSFQGQFKLILSNQGLYTRPLAVEPQILASREYTHLAHLFHLILVTTPYIFACCHPFTSFACSLDRVEIKAAAGLSGNSLNRRDEVCRWRAGVPVLPGRGGMHKFIGGKISDKLCQMLTPMPCWLLPEKGSGGGSKEICIIPLYQS